MSNIYSLNLHLGMFICEYYVTPFCRASLSLSSLSFHGKSKQKIDVNTNHTDYHVRTLNTQVPYFALDWTQCWLEL